MGAARRHRGREASQDGAVLWDMLTFVWRAGCTLTTAERAVLTAMWVRRSIGSWEVFPSLETLAADTAVSARQVSRIVERLVTVGAISRTLRSRGRRVNVYLLQPGWVYDQATRPNHDMVSGLGTNAPNHDMVSGLEEANHDIEGLQPCHDGGPTMTSRASNHDTMSNEVVEVFQGSTREVVRAREDPRTADALAVAIQTRGEKLAEERGNPDIEGEVRLAVVDWCQEPSSTKLYTALQKLARRLGYQKPEEMGFPSATELYVSCQDELQQRQESMTPPVHVVGSRL